MRKTTVILLSLFYLLLFSGIPVTIHYCRGNAEKIRFFSAEDMSCCCEHSCCFSKSCCHNEHHWVKADINEQLYEQRVQLNLYHGDFLAEKIRFSIENEPEKKPVTIPFYGHAPPGNVPIWLLHCTLIYYS